MILTAKNINKSYHSGSIENSVLMELDFQLNDREIVAIRGASGSGKSTFLNILGLLDSPDSGELKMDGRQIRSMQNRLN